MIRVTDSGSFKNTLSFLGKMQKNGPFDDLDRYGKMGVDALASATPRDSGETAASWSYKIERNAQKVSISWYNDEGEGKTKVAILLQYGHGTGTGGYVAGQDYINPAMKPIFDRIATDVWRKVTNG